MLAAQTERLRMGLMVAGNTYRNPAVHAHIAATVDLISGGRPDFGIGAGWKVYEAGFDLRGLQLRPVPSGKSDRVTLDLGPLLPAHAAGLIDTLRSLDGVQVVSYSLGEQRPPSQEADGENRDLAGDSS